MTQSIPWHALDVDEVFGTLHSNRAGLTEEEVARRLEEYGPNAIESERRTSPWTVLLNQVRNPLVAVLVVAAVISILAGHTVDAIVIAVVILVNSMIGFSQEYRAEEAIAALKARAAPEAEVLRIAVATGEGVEMSVKTTDVVPGDVVLLSVGDKVPADARVFEAVNLEMDESMLTGESTTVRKVVEPFAQEATIAERRNVVYAGTIITQGRGQALVYATGGRTEMGKIAHLIQETEKAESPLSRQMTDLGKKLALLALAVSLLTLLVGLVRGFAFTDMFLFALASAVSSIPEGLPAVMTITLALGVNRMARRNAIIRRLEAVDTLGAATVICTDKTGTLTTNEMTVQRFYVEGREIHVSGAGLDPIGEFISEGRGVDPGGPDAEGRALGLALQIGALCNDARLSSISGEKGQRHELRGDPTEGALLVAADKANMPRDALEAARPRVDEIPFSSPRKHMATFHDLGDGHAAAYVKGAPETVLGMCSGIVWGGEAVALTDAHCEMIRAANETMAAGALRVLGLAYHEMPLSDVAEFREDLEGLRRADLTMVGLVGMMDPPRPQVPSAVETCRKAGIKVVMATGDHHLTGRTIARQVGILDEGGRVLTGAEMETMSDADLDAVIGETPVFARVSPEHKHRIVESLQRQGHVVAMTGDGINDAPALQASQIGVAMGITGTDVTKETADMVLTDDNFASIVAAVEEGRAVFENVRKVVKFLLATNIGEDLTIISALLILPIRETIISPIQILWVNLVTDGLLDITIAMEPKESEVMQDPPRSPNESIISRDILFNIAYVAIFMAIGTLWTFVRASEVGGLTYSRTMTFTTMAMFQVFNALNCRSRTRSIFQIKPGSNKYLLVAIAVSVALQFAATRVPLLQNALDTHPLSWADWGAIVLTASSVLVADEVRKLVQRRYRARHAAEHGRA